MASFAIFAVHISDGVLGWPVLAIGFVVAGVLAALATWRVREEEIPRVALMTAAFFVASSIHVKIGPTSAHLLLNGLVGVVLGWRAPLAILVGITMQAILIPHGGISTIGVNTCAETLPALLGAALFTGLSGVSDKRRWFRSLLVAVAAVVWGWCLVFGVAVLAAAPSNVLSFSSQAGLIVRADELAPVFAIVLHPLVPLGLLILAGLAVALELRLKTPAGFPCGALVGVVTVLATAALSAGFLLIGTDGDAPQLDKYITALFLAHLPLALVEGLIVGCVVGFLWRVKPQMLARLDPSAAVILACLSLCALASPARAHGFNVKYEFDRQKQEMTVHCFYETGEAPEIATVQVFDRAGKLLVEGKADEKGQFTFRYDKIEDLRIEVFDYPVGQRPNHAHKARFVATAAELAGGVPQAGHEGNRLHDLFLGVALLLAAAAFVMAWRNSVRINRLEESLRTQQTEVK